MVTFNSQSHLQARLKELMNQQGCLATYCVVQDLRQVSVFFLGGMCVLVCRLHIVCICIQHIYMYYNKGGSLFFLFSMHRLKTMVSYTIWK